MSLVKVALCTELTPFSSVNSLPVRLKLPPLVRQTNTNPFLTRPLQPEATAFFLVHSLVLQVSSRLLRLSSPSVSPLHVEYFLKKRLVVLHLIFPFVLPAAVFGPNDGAFTALGDSFAQLAANETALFDILAGHVVQGAFTAAQVRAAGCVELDTLAGTKLKVEFNEDHDHSALAGHTGAMGAIMVNEAHILDEDLSGEDGVFHGIEKVILPGTFTPCPTTAPTAAPEEDSAASVVSTSVAMVAAVAAFFAF
jgi:hypothetical protein